MIDHQSSTTACIHLGREPDHGVGPASSHLALRAYFFVAFGAIGLYVPYFPAWLRARGFVGWQMSVLAALLPFCQLLSPALVGMLADRLGLRGRMMTFCAVVSALGLSSIAVLSGWVAPLPLPWALACMFVFALLRSPTVGLADVLAMEIARNYGRMRLFGSLGFLTTSLYAGHFIDISHPTALPAAIACCLWLLALFSLLLPKTSRLPPRPALEDARHLLSKSSYRQLLLTMMLIFCSFSAYDLCITLRLVELGAPGPLLGGFWALATGAEVVLLFFAHRLLASFGPGQLLTFSCIVSVVRWTLVAQSRDVTLLVWLQPLHAVSFGLMWASAMGVLKREVGALGTGTAQGLYSSAIAVGGTCGMMLWGPIYDALGSARVFELSALVMAMAAVSAARLIRLSKRLAYVAS